MNFIDTEAEERILSSMLHSETAAIECLTMIQLDDLYNPLNRDIFSLAKTLFGRGINPTYVEVIKEGMSLGMLKTASDMEDIKHIAGQYIDDKNIKYWIDRVRNASKRRQANDLLKTYSHKITEDIDTNQFIQMAGSEFMQLAMDNGTETIESAADVARFSEQLFTNNCDRWRKAQDDCGFNAPLEGVSTGVPRLDDITLGYKPGDLVILGAQTGHGKTAMALNTALACCINGNKPLLYVNTEMSRKQIAYRWGSILSEIPLYRIRNGNLKNEELQRVNDAMRSFAQSNFYTSYIPNLTPEKSQTLARKAKLQHDIELLIIDYVGRMDTSDPRHEEWQVLYGIVKAQKLLAQNLDIACMVLVQLNSDGSLQGAKRMKNECDLMLKLLPLCEDLLDDEQRSKAQEKFEKKYGRHYEEFNYYIWIDKSRDSEAGVCIPLVFAKEIQQIREAREV